LLRYLDTLVENDIPVLGINFGHRGYLTACEPQCALSKILEALEGKVAFESRMLYDCEIFDKNGNVREKITGLNEAVLSRGGLCRAIDFTIFINGNSVLSFPADGVIVSTPTGSTAYNFSAQGPILMPEARNLAITPICASSLLHSSLVTTRDDTVELRICGDRLLEETEKPTLVADGFRKISVDFSDKITVKRSEKELRIYGGEAGSFLRVLQNKMR
jgi:NAD+ kinase